MNILFLSLLDFNTIEEHNIYTDLLREFRKHGHNIFVVSPVERRKKGETGIIEEEKTKILKIRIGNIQKTNIIEKGISTLLLEHQLIFGVKKFFSNIKFDLVLYPTPPITLVKVIEYIKKRDNAKTYLLLKDIFPQNAVDLGMMTKNGLKGVIYHYFRMKEKKLYELSEIIGCMSQANVDYVLRHNPEISDSKAEICPNSIEVIDKSVNDELKRSIRIKHNIPLDKIIFVYGGNLGKPQGVDFLIECIKGQVTNDKVFFVVVGDGTEYNKLETFINTVSPVNVKLMKRLQKDEYDDLVAACDVGMIFLDYRFTIPNFPSRLLGYMQAKIPVLACTDPNTDIGNVIVAGEFGWWCKSNDEKMFFATIQKILIDLKTHADMGEKEFEYLKKYYSVERVYNTIYKHCYKA